MSQDITAILLPQARVDFFALDAGTAATAERLAADWRFARVGITVARDNIAAAIAHYSANASPEMIIIETDDISDDFLAKLGQLAGVCAAGTDAVIVGPMNDVHLYRNLVGMGVRDYLVRPVAEHDFVSVIAKALVEKRGLAGARLIAVMGSKGGVGTTAIAQTIAWQIAETLRQKTILMDAAGSAGSLGIAFGLEPVTNMTEAIRIGASGTDDDMKRIVQTAGENLSLLCYGGEPILTDIIDADGAETLVNRLMQKNPVVVADLSGASHAVQKRLMARASHVVMVTSPLLPSLRNARGLLSEIKHIRSGLKEVDVVLNFEGLGGADEVPAKDIKGILDVDLAAKIAYAPKVFIHAEATGKPASSGKGGAEAVRGLLDIAIRASGKTARTDAADKKDQGLLGFLKGKKGK